MTAWERGEGWGVVDRPDGSDRGGCLYAASLVSGEIMVLQGAAAAVARAALESLDTTAIREAAAADLGVGQDEVDEDVVDELLEELVTLGLLRSR
ncbi:hypothetical protein [Ornithinimicrobium cerasi]|uniref:Coenzyme PQQ synthesis protein D (PqqD) n=1 Tax=Ornithinimicrobium cerasi TaxID=2248773 RepID=A0A285VWC6_9MICO|nr:hypothetical protein [Ornithinimicrobium cerasi]SOC58322.1 hypothetical protein SAMN05421879_1295 [Ornithinimicrobium cerasi]